MASVEEGIPVNEKEYTRMGQAWPLGDRIIINIDGAPDSMRIPLDFVRKSGNNTWHLVHRMISALVNEPGQLQNATGDKLPLDSVPEAGEFHFMPITSGIIFSWRQGPTGSRKGLAANEWQGDCESEEEDPVINYYPPDERQFAERIYGRDAVCLLTHYEYRAEATHIVPKNRLDIYANVLDDRDTHVFERSMGLLLYLPLRYAFQYWEWSLYYQSGSYFVHVFVPNDELVRQYHGKEIAPSRFASVFPASDHPDPRLCNWHYEQCLMMRLRGFSSGMAVNAA